MSEEETLDHVARIFLHRYNEKIDQISRENKRFVHYTSSSALFSIVDSNQFWMRNALLMNDYAEIAHGRKCIDVFLRDKRKENFAKALSICHENVFEEALNNFLSATKDIYHNTFILSISEHEDAEDNHGRLSMWRAYGSNTGIALVLNNHAFVTPTDALDAYTYPVLYCAPSDYPSYWDRTIELVNKNIQFLKTIERDTIKFFVKELLVGSLYAVKHPGFSEEREWRVVYLPKHNKSRHIIEKLTVYKDIPQIIQCIPLIDLPDEGLTGIEVRSIINRVIIGPTYDGRVIYDAICEKLKQIGFQTPESIISVSDIPLKSK